MLTVVTELSAIRNNIAEAKKRLSGSLMLMVKANAYGHGLVAVARAVEDEVDAFGVAAAAEGAELRLAGIKKPVLVAAVEDVDLIFSYNLTAAVKSLDDVLALKNCARRHKRSADVMIKCDTGMHRFGVTPSEFSAVYEAVNKSEYLHLFGTFTHLYSSRAEEVAESLAVFEPMRGADSHALASDNLFMLGADNARIGLAAYGYVLGATLQPSLSCYASVLSVKLLKAGDGVGYNHSYICKGDTFVATVGAGYGDGIMRRQKSALIRGYRVPVIGDICMDALMLDVTATGARIGDKVTLLGTDGGASLTAAEVAAECGTIPYEILTNYRGGRLRRVYLA